MITFSSDFTRIRLFNNNTIAISSLSDFYQSWCYFEADLQILRSRPWHPNPSTLITGGEFSAETSISIVQDVCDCRYYVNLDDDDPESVSTLLTLVYRDPNFVIGWDNVEVVLELADKYIFSSSLQDCERLLEISHQQKPLTTLYIPRGQGLGKAVQNRRAVADPDLHVRPDRATSMLYDCFARAPGYRSVV
ncbi:hypothetical protein BC938DRAFT_472540 [Jimgerdemannia flammicorona]|uniref:BTB domain-containing protein n=1 Tax=Jimgerdemannia flammicorona TaxID=994334 RepID=A0A433QTV4_9FUNG|nr:hypothetical protein BC938DRAFT_472540 [Jimgerdemannia flammicorona]